MAVKTVGIGKQYSTIPSAIAAAQDGDTIQVDAGTYANQYASIAKNLTLEGVGGKVKMTSTGLIPNGKGILVIDGNVTISNFEFSGAEVADQNGAGIRFQSGNLTLNNTGFFNNENGILTNNPGVGSLSISDSEFGDNGYDLPSGQAHGLYVGHIGSLTVNNSYFHGVLYGHEIKSRAVDNTITNSRIYDLNSTASYTIDLPNGGNASIKGNVIEQVRIRPTRQSSATARKATSTQEPASLCRATQSLTTKPAARSGCATRPLTSRKSLITIFMA